MQEQEVGSLVPEHWKGAQVQELEVGSLVPEHWMGGQVQEEEVGTMVPEQERRMGSLVAFTN